MSKLKTIFKNIVWWSGVVTIGLVFGLSLQFARAWVEPTMAPPGGNVGAPINTSVLTQVKAGVLGVAGLVTNAFRMPTNAGAGKVLTSDASGNGTWQKFDGVYLGMDIPRTNKCAKAGQAKYLASDCSVTSTGVWGGTRYIKSYQNCKSKIAVLYNRECYEADGGVGSYYYGKDASGNDVWSECFQTDPCLVESVPGG